MLGVGCLRGMVHSQGGWWHHGGGESRAVGSGGGWEKVSRCEGGAQRAEGAGGGILGGCWRWGDGLLCVKEDSKRRDGNLEAFAYPTHVENWIYSGADAEREADRKTG